MTRDEQIEQLTDEIAEVASMVFAGEARFIRLVGEFDALGGWADGHTRSCAHWLNWRLGIAMPAARERVRVARRLRGLPELAATFKDGRLSYSKVRAITRVATSDTEQTLINLALHATAAQMERICRTWRRVATMSLPDAADRQRRSQRLRVWIDDDGSVRIDGVLPTDVGATVLKALSKAADLQFTADGGPTSPDDADARRVTALQMVAEAFLAPTTGSSSADHWQVQVTVDADVLALAADGVAAADPEPSPEWTDGCDDDVPQIAVEPDRRPPLALLPDGTPLPNPVLRRLACDTTLVGMTTETDGTPVGIGRRRRTIPGWLRRMLHQRDPGCMFPGCPNIWFTDGHHILHWADGGPTDLDNLVRLCRAHHTMVHDRGLAISQHITDRSWVFHQTDGTLITPVPVLTGAPHDATAVVDGAADTSAGAGARSGVRGWTGDPARLDYIIDALVNVSAETPVQDWLPAA